ncbi:MAG: hypothetical protein J0H09_16685 [Burkholderiales bacterium]|nr:hypothetical protein [Burkholderiales bacterium]
MRIERIRASLLQLPATAPAPARRHLFVEVFDSDGAAGMSISEWDSAAAPGSFVDECLAPAVIGRDAAAVVLRWHDMQAALAARKSAADATGVAVLAAIDAALWDLHGKRMGAPLFRLWGEHRTALDAVATGLAMDESGGDPWGAPRPADIPGTDENIASSIDAARRAGFGGIVLTVARGRSPGSAAQALHAARSHAGDEFALCVDGGSQWVDDDALAFAQRAVGATPAWFSNPCRAATPEALARIRGNSGIALAAAPPAFGDAALVSLLAAQAVEVCRLASRRCGGPTAWLRAARQAACFGVGIAHPGDPLLAAHLLAAVGNGANLELSVHSLTALAPVAHVGHRLRDGRLELDAAPGWGIRVDAEAVRRYASSS